MRALVRVVDELRDFDVDLPSATPTLDFPDVQSPAFSRWDRHDVFADLEQCWSDAAGARFTNLLCARRSGELFVSVGRVRPLSDRRAGERCLAPVRGAAGARGPMRSFWPCFVELDLPLLAAARGARTDADGPA